MLIEGPLKIEIAEPADGQGKLLMVSFPDAFREVDSTTQVQQITDYLNLLAGHINDASQEVRTRQGMAIVHQFVEQLVPHIQAEELALEETIIVQIRQEGQVGALVDLLAKTGD